jgi:SAM-dependent methyltransferase
MDIRISQGKREIMNIDGFLKNIEERINPKAVDDYYLVLSDLRLFLDRFRTDKPLLILDYGAGNSPYRSLFPNAEYRRADYVDISGIDYLVPYDSTLPISNALFDLIISTQVAEHLPVPSNYFSEAFRVLKPGGRLIVTTHGTWKDHGVPFDFQRWTADGLRRDLEDIGFAVNGVFKLTSSHRSYVFLLLDWLGNVYSGKRHLFARAFTRLVRSVVRSIRPVIHLVVDHLWPECRVVGPLNLETHHLYCVLAAEAVKPPYEMNISNP